MEALSTNSFSPAIESAMDVEDSYQCTSTEDSIKGNFTNFDKRKRIKNYKSQIKQIKPLLSGASTFETTVSRLFDLLKKVSKNYLI